MPRQVTNAELTQLVDTITKYPGAHWERRIWLCHLQVLVDAYLEQTEQDVENWLKEREAYWEKNPPTTETQRGLRRLDLFRREMQTSWETARRENATAQAKELKSGSRK